MSAYPAKDASTSGQHAAVRGWTAGAAVQVKWSDGKRYPATVSQVLGPRALIAFPNGYMHWVEVTALEPA